MALGSRQSRTIALPIPVPAGLNPAHTYEVRAYADCKGTGSAIERLQACYAAPATAGEITESNETNNTTGHGTIVASNVARVDAQPDSITLTAIGDTTVFAAAAYDRANAAVSGVSFAWTSLDPAIASASGATIRALATGVARIVVSSEGRVDTSRVYVIQLTASVLATPDSVTLSSVGDAVQFSAVVYDHNNNAIPGAPITWTSLDAGLDGECRWKRSGAGDRNGAHRRHQLGTRGHEPSVRRAAGGARDDGAGQRGRHGDRRLDALHRVGGRQQR